MTPGPGERAIMVGMRDSDNHVRTPGTKAGYRCSQCAESVSLAPSGQSFVAQYPETVIICWRCHAPQSQDEVVLAPGAAQEIRDYLLARRRN